MAESLGIGYYFEHWNTDFFSISIVLAIGIILAGYFYGRVFERFSPSLKKIDTTPLGVLFILAIYQIYVFYAVEMRVSTDVSFIVFKLLMIAGPLLCLVTWSNVVPKLKNLLSILVIILISIPICKASMELNTNNLFFDSITYLSQTLESSVGGTFGRIDYTTGYIFQSVEALHDYTGYYYFWGMVLRYARDYFEIKTSMTPIYIWGSTVLYTSLLGSTIVSGVLLLQKKLDWKACLTLVIATLFMAPYYTNYFNTTLAFFGNTVRPVIVAWSLMLIYEYFNSKDSKLLIATTMTYYAGMNVTSSYLFLCAFMTSGLLFTMAFKNIKDYKHWIAFSTMVIPIVHYAILIATSISGYWKPVSIAVGLFALVALIAFLIRKHFKMFNTVFRVLFPIVLIGLIVVSFMVRNIDYGYDFYFATRSLNDMCVNMTSSTSRLETIRNVLFYLLFALLFVNFKKEKMFKVFILVICILFLNPLVQPAVSTYLTLSVYSRTFDLLTNPFVLIFMVYNISLLIPNLYVQLPLLLALGASGAYHGKYNLTNPYTKNLEFKEEGYNWEYKTSDDTYDLYTYINENIINDWKLGDDLPSFLSQDIGLKGYVPHIYISFSCTQFRDCMSNDDLFAKNEDMILIMHPEKRWDDFEINGKTGDLSKFKDVVLDYDPDYVIVSNTLSVWDERGWYEKVYQKAVHQGLCEIEFENDVWVLLKINHEFVEPQQ